MVSGFSLFMRIASTLGPLVEWLPAVHDQAWLYGAFDG